ncbi:MAG TPA: hypothetical protein VK445_08865, partial [Dissulfurispiraceae bacterium]|nr:hypothetical protein [Dissulfurispiraceae bacterium]
MNTADTLILDPLKDVVLRITQFLPNVGIALVLFLVGIIIARLSAGLLRRLLRAVGLDNLAERSGYHALMQKAGIRQTAADAAGKLLSAFLVLVFSILALRALQVPAIENLFGRLLLYVPNVVLALLILLGGFFLANFFGRAALIAAVNAGLPMARFAGLAV